MGSRMAKLLGLKWLVGAERTLESFTFETELRKYLVPVGTTLEARNHTPRTRVVRGIEGEVGEDARVVFADGGKKPRLSSFAVDYDLELHQLEGEAPLPPIPPPRPAREGSQEATTGEVVDGKEGDHGPVEVERVDRVEGWPLALVRGEKRPRIGHREVARRLGYADEKDLLGLADRVFGAEWKLRARYAEFRRGSRGPASRDYLLTRHEVIRLTMRSDAPNADALQEEIARVFEAWLDGRLAAAAPPLEDPTHIALRILGREGVELRAAVGAADAKATEAHAAAAQAVRDAASARSTAEEARAVAEEARSVAKVAANPAGGMPPGASRRVPEGSVSADVPPGYLSMRGVARRFVLPACGEGANFVSRVADALHVEEIEGAVLFADVVIAGSARRSQRRFGPLAIERMRPALMAAHATMVAFGFEVIGDVMRARAVARRSKTWVLEQMLEAAVATSPRGPGANGQQSIPGVENDGAAKAS